MIEIQGVSQRFQGVSGAVDAVRDVTLSIRKGEIFGIIGRSGAGKSSLVRTLNLLNRPTAGSVTIDGRGTDRALAAGAARARGAKSA